MEGEQTGRPGRPRSEAARRAILRAALALLKKHGVAGVTAEAVAERARVSKATLYRWWPCAAATAMDAFFEEVSSRVPSSATDAPLDDLRSRARHVSRLLGGPLGDVLAGLIAATHADPRLAQSFHERYLRPSRENLRRVVDRAVDAGALRDDVDRDVLIDVICAAYYYRKLVRHEDTTPRTMDAIMSCVLDGLVPRARAGITARRRRPAAAAPASPARRRTRAGSASPR
ncbi:MAG: TetR/AcrR family transcriptional regulator C-terminal ligand-binding domain-containing protein [Thermodesulfobacteriota bacterium]